MKNLVILIGFLISIICVITIFAQTPTELLYSYEKFIVKNSVNPELAVGKQDSIVVVFNDPHLEQAVRDALSKPTGDIYDSDMATITSLIAENESISDLTGLEYAVNLSELDLDYNLIVDITSLQGLDSLIHLELSANKINDIMPLHDLISLSHLRLMSNQISDIIALQNLINLQYLYLDANPISDFNALQNLISLIHLRMNSLEISDISMLQNLTNLKYLYLENNQITDITPLQNLNQLDLLFMGSNSVSDVTPLQNLTTLANIKLSSNQISDISPLQNLTKLYQLILSNNQIHDITAVQNLTDLQYLILWGNQIKDITPVQNLTNLVSLHLMDNKITDITVLQNLTNLTFLHLNSNPVQDITVLQELTNLTSLWVSNLQLTDIIPLQNLIELENLGLEENLLDNEDLTKLYNLDKLTFLYLGRNPGIISGTAVQVLADNLDPMNCEDIDWDGTCGIDHNLAVICWVEPSDSADVGQTVTVQTTATDSNQAQVQMKINWGDGNVSDYSELKTNASTFEFTHTYSGDESYNIKVIGKNEFGFETDWSESHTIVVGEPTVSVETEIKHIYEFSLCQNFPNPFNPTTTIRYDLPQSVKVNISIYNMLGQKVKVLENKFQPVGSHQVQWDGKDEHGNPHTSGIYICRIQAGKFRQSIKLILIK